ncbi:cytochrome-c peroxidase [Photobacterium proteolyticum]|uniref:cytochrome-c peroxidase n=1 Tax=Photobacterium proteolyticum TaxID=1903952 RepID=UPI001FE873C6|nr:cytochrome c peroxidase [Photobacterium proteolyticum]
MAILSSLRLPKKWEVNDASNLYLHDKQAVLLGERLFSDTQLSRSKQVACASCHQPEHYFTLNPDNDLSITKQVPSLLGAANFNWYMLDGRADSLWAQALKPLENHIEHGGTRTQYVLHVLDKYPQLYQTIFGPIPDELTDTVLPAQASPSSQYPTEQQQWHQLDKNIQEAINRVFANIGKSLAAYQATLWPVDTRFDRYVDQMMAATEKSSLTQAPLLDAQEVAGLKIFINEQGQCLRCHNGPLLSNGGFHATTIPEPHPDAQKGHRSGLELAFADPFNCLGRYSDSLPSQCKELLFSKRAADELKGATKVPSLRNVSATAPYMHAGQFSTLKDVLQYYNRAAKTIGTHSDIAALKLLPYQLNQLEAFLLTLTAAPNNESAK